jgi:hypothetical protein
MERQLLNQVRVVANNQPLLFALHRYQRISLTVGAISQCLIC